MATERPVHALQIVAGDEMFALEFLWQQDRFAHRVVRQLDAEHETLLQSREGTQQQIWPVSPPFQDISVETQAGERVALLVGMAGKSHWSASVTPADSRQPGWEFDVACLVKEPPQWLGSSYHYSQAGRTVVQCETLRNCIPSAGLATQHLELRCETPVESTRQTLRWKYRLYIAD